MTPAQRQRALARRKAARRRKRIRTMLVVLLLTLLCLLASCVAGILLGNNEEEPPATVPDLHNGMVEVPYGKDSIWIYPIEGLPTREWTQDQFEKQEDGTITYNGRRFTARAGVDVSSHQGEIDWEAAAKGGVQFAYIRAGYRGYTEGVLNVDKRFYQNLEAAHKAGIDCGVYFYSQALSDEEAAEEAAYLLDLLKGYEDLLSLPICYDWEIDISDGSRTLNADTTLATGYARAFCDVIADAGYQTCVYFNRSMGYYSFDLGQLADCDFWCADVSSWPTFYYATRFWQYTDKGRLPGFDTDVDLDICFAEA